MQSLGELQGRIEGARDLQSIVRVMKSLSAVSIRQYQDAARRLRSYQSVVDLSLGAALSTGAFAWRQSAEPGPGSGLGLVVMGSDRGLCGRFNVGVAEAAARLVLQASGKGSQRILAIGARAAARLEALGLEPDTIFFQPGSAAGLTDTAGSVIVEIEDWRNRRGIERVSVVFNVATEREGIELRVEQLLPIDPSAIDALATQPWPTNNLPATRGEPDAVFSALMRERLFVALMRAGAESLAAEHATRLRAMQAAEKNINERLDDLAADWRRTRQDEITTELMDIVSAYEAVSSRAS
ncbi:F0F1 ATP synthase subunit gamma [Limibaculum sp. M0105]|uniref:F0F1 ATP synthase subunit gamma n=1 Tax=Thermohalobaculum xanthum TaxID=2753746 RepID=A0A8J7M754_9RHOB|nr:F0F1 ATP synthase subunit gamma [Thermohalobaculum xanthum]MBK0399533.1 F0F1 ATP synthase subunit gamma [Thermohalobaculum xanthum]